MGVEQIKRVVVLMLENRSFDHMLGAVPGVEGAQLENSNVDSRGTVYHQAERDNFSLPIQFDPKHEFPNVQTQLGAQGVPHAMRPMSGFGLDAEATAMSMPAYSQLPSNAARQSVVQSVMDHFSLGALPGLHTLAGAFSVCDHWFASVPGPTWPNRFFAMMGSCHGQLQMPSGPGDAVVTVRSISAQLGKESIFSVLGGGMHRIYSDYLVPLSVFLKGADQRASLDDFEQDVDSGQLPAFSWIEPDYSNNLAKANSQHPPENVLRGDNLIIRVYNKLRASALWNETLLVVLHDEHGGFYDHVPPVPTESADDSPSHPAFDYSYTGVRVPCVLISPWVQRGAASQAYDHTSLLAFLCDQFQKSDQRSLLGRRVASADHFGSALIWCDVARTDTPASIKASAIVQVDGEEANADLDDLLPKLLVGLHAHAQNQAPEMAVPAATTQAAEAATTASHDARIVQAWKQGGTLESADVEAMLAKVKQTFAR